MKRKYLFIILTWPLSKYSFHVSLILNKITSRVIVTSHPKQTKKNHYENFKQKLKKKNIYSKHFLRVLKKVFLNYLQKLRVKKF